MLSIVNAGSAGNIRFQNSSGSNDAGILEDGSNNMVIRAGSANIIQFEDSSGATIWGNISSANGGEMYMTAGYYLNDGSHIGWNSGGSEEGAVIVLSGYMYLRSNNETIYFQDTAGATTYATLSSSELALNNSQTISTSGSLSVGSISASSIYTTGTVDFAGGTVSGSLTLLDPSSSIPASLDPDEF